MFVLQNPVILNVRATDIVYELNDGLWTVSVPADGGRESNLEELCEALFSPCSDIYHQQVSSPAICGCRDVGACGVHYKSKSAVSIIILITHEEILNVEFVNINWALVGLLQGKVNNDISIIHSIGLQLSQTWIFCHLGEVQSHKEFKSSYLISVVQAQVDHVVVFQPTEVLDIDSILVFKQCDILFRDKTWHLIPV